MPKCHNCGLEMDDGEYLDHKDHPDGEPRYHRNLWECIENLKAKIKKLEKEKKDG